jgi:hypothetical protein
VPRPCGAPPSRCAARPAAPTPRPQVTLRHEDTGNYLHSLRHATFGHPISGNNEVCAVKKAGKDSRWYAAEGVYLPQTEAGAAGGAAGSGGKVEL